MTKTIQLRAQKGVRNDVSLERFDRDSLGRSTGFTDLSEAVNLDLDETGKLARRLGTELLVPGDMHSLYADGDIAYVVDNDMLCQLLPDMSLVPVLPVKARVAMTRAQNAFYWSDYQQSGTLTGAQNAPWGIAVPPKFDAIQIPGDLREGTYLYAMTYVRSTGEESGAIASSGITVTPNSGLGFPVLPVSTDPLVIQKRIYLSDRNGEALYLAATLPNAATSTTLTALPALSVVLRTQFMGPPPVGQVVSTFCGRTLVASGDYLWYSQPYEYGLFDLRNGFVGFTSQHKPHSSAVRTIACVTDGIFVGTDSSTFWLNGADPTQWQLNDRANYGTVLGTEVQLLNYLTGDENGAPGTVMGWMSTKGFCLGFDGGEMKNVTGGRHIPPVASEGASLLKIRGGTPQIVTTLYS